MNRFPKIIRRKILRVVQSPLNPKQSLLELECGHAVWMNSTRKPTATAAACEKCTKAVNEKCEGNDD
jgi:hypothetical protein